jgi:hypothetical protein
MRGLDGSDNVRAVEAARIGDFAGFTPADSRNSPLVEVANGPENASQAISNVPISEPEDAETQSLQVGVSIHVVGGL